MNLSSEAIELLLMQTEDDRGGLLRYIDKIERGRKADLTLLKEVKTLTSLIDIPNEILLEKFRKGLKRKKETVIYCQETTIKKSDNKTQNSNYKNKKITNKGSNVEKENLPQGQLQEQVQETEAHKTGKVAKVIEVVRGKDARKALRGFDCEHCRQFYEGFVKQYGEERAAQMKQECSRHRSRFTPPKTPEGYWDLSMQSPWNDDNN